MNNDIDHANHAALQRLYAVRPQWRDVRCARDAVGLDGRTLLHAGPPFADHGRPSAPVLSSAVLCCLYEGWAASEPEAERLIAGGSVTLASAQSFGVVTPLAAVISPRTALVEIADAADPVPRAWSLLASGAGPQIRFGGRSGAILERMTWRDEALARALVKALTKGPVDLVPLARLGLDHGDDLHSRTTSATAALCEQLESRSVEKAVNTMLGQTPLFFLTLWMAACHLMMSAAARSADPLATLVIALAGNGQEVGIRLAGQASRWFTASATAPAGPRIDLSIDLPAAPLTGDSGVIDAAGFGAQALALAPEPAAAFASWLPGQWREQQARLYAGKHPAFAELHVGLDAARVAKEGIAPLAAIAMIAADGRAGLLGRGLYAAPVALFTDATRNASPSTMLIDDPKTLAAVEAAFDAYELALTSNDVAMLDALFWDSPSTLRYGAAENLKGYEAIRVFRAARPGKGLMRTIVDRSITTFGADCAVANIVFTRDGEARAGRQSQTWVRVDGQWRVVAAHVSWMDA
jgi:hypothetical protein